MSIEQKIHQFSRRLLYALILVVYGVMIATYNLAPLPQIRDLGAMIRAVFQPLDQVLYTDVVNKQDERSVETYEPSKLQTGLIAVLLDTAPRKPAIHVIDRDGRIVHEWKLNWLEIWPRGEGNFLDRPIKGTHAHGLKVFSDGRVTTNFEYQSTFQLDLCGNIVWKQDNHGHHAVADGHDGTIWVPTEARFEKGESPYIGQETFYRADSLLEMDDRGASLRSIDLTDVFIEQEMHGLLHVGPELREILRQAGVHRPDIQPLGDTLHVNDIEVFPADIDSDVFNPGDLLVSARNINAIFVIDPETERLKWLYSGGFVRQHDPDFTDRGTITLFDNFGHLSRSQIGREYSRIIEIDPVKNTQTTLLGSDLERPFYTRINGSHELLPNGNILVVPSQEGRLLEYTPDGDLVWRYDHRVSERKNGRVYNTQLLPAHMDEEFFATAQRKCQS